MPDILEGTVIDIIDDRSVEVAVDRVLAQDPQAYGASVRVRLSDAPEAADDEPGHGAARMGLTFHNRRVRCFVERHDGEGHVVGEIEVLSAATPDDLLHPETDDES